MFIRPEDRIISFCLVAQCAAVPTPAKSKYSKKCTSAPGSYEVILKWFYEMVVVFTCSLAHMGLENGLLL